MRDFKLSKSFLAGYEGLQPLWGPLGYVVYKRTYSRDKEDGTHEEYWETVKRVVEGVYSIQKQHCKNLGLPWNNEKAHRSAQEMYQRIWDFKFTPPGRGFWMMGTEYIDRIGSAPLQNCGMVSTAEIKTSLALPLTWAMDMLMLGVGVGFDTTGAGTCVIQEPKQGDYVYVVEDSREGWVAALRRLVNAYQGRKSLPVRFDFSAIRPEGAPIRGFGGTSSGYKPLDQLLGSTARLLSSRVGCALSSVDIADLFCLVGRCVVSGNVRRSALLSLGSALDDEFMTMKNPQIFALENREIRWASNNSISADIGMEYQVAADSTAKNGEPGYVWLHNMRKYGRMKDPPNWKDRYAVGVNPCGEQTLGHMETCNLVETFPARHDSFEDYKRTLKYAYLYAKTVTLLPTHNEKTNAVMMKNRRIGCSMSGITQALTKFGTREFLKWADAGYEYIQNQDEVYSSWLCVPRSIKTTSVKPSGSVSLLCGATPGIHFAHSEYYIRRVRFQKDSYLVSALKQCGYKTEVDVCLPSTTVVVEFPVHEEHFTKGKTSVTMWEQLELAAQLQAYWADNQVSATITFTADEAKDIAAALSLYETRLKSISFLPLTEHSYAQPPYEEITAGVYGEMVARIDSSRLPEILEAANVHDKTEKFCTTDKCDIEFDVQEK